MIAWTFEAGRFPRPFAYEDVSVTNATATLTSADCGAARCVLIYFENGPVRVRLDGGTPVAGGSGILVQDGTNYMASRQEAQSLVAIRDGVTNGTLRVTYYG